MAIERYRRKVYKTDLIEELIEMERRLRASSKIGPLIAYVEERQLLGHEVMLKQAFSRFGYDNMNLPAAVFGKCLLAIAYGILQLPDMVHFHPPASAWGKGETWIRGLQVEIHSYLPSH